MIQMIFVFVVVFAIIYGGIEAFKHLTKSEKWDLTKNVLYSTIISVVTLLLLTFFYIAF
jgi:hypothetical protein